jgi:hypothetical protein
MSPESATPRRFVTICQLRSGARRFGAGLCHLGRSPVNFSSQAADLASELPLKAVFSAEVILA